MRIHNSIILFGTLAMLVAGVACNPATAHRPTGKMIVVVSILPQSYFVSRIGGDLVDVHVMVGPGQSHHTYEPTPRQIAELSKAQAYFRIGVPFERGLIEKIGATLSHLEIVDTSRGVPLRDSAESCDDEHHDHHHEGGKDPHIWLAPRLVKIQARTMADALIRLDPAHGPDYERNLKSFETDLDAIDARLARTLAPLFGREFYVFHPAYGYFGDAYGLKQVSVEEEGKEPSLKRIEQLIGRAKRAGVKLIFMQPQFPVAAAKTVANAIGGAVVQLDPLAPDYLRNLKFMADQIAAAIRPAAVSAVNTSCASSKTSKFGGRR